MLTIFSLMFVLFTVEISCQEPIPSFFHICRTSDPQYDACFLRSVLSLKPYFRTGVEDVFPSLEPYRVPRLVIADAQNPILGLSVYLKNIDIYGASNFGIRNLRIARGVGKSSFDINLFNLYIEGDYRIFGRTLLSVPVDIVGKIYANLTNSQAECRMMSRMDVGGGLKYAQIDRLQMSTYTQAATVLLKANNHQQDLPVMMINAAVNWQFQYFSQGTARRLEVELEQTLKTAINMRLGAYSYDDLFPV